MNVADFDALTPDAAGALLLDCLHGQAWADAVVAGRPYGDFDALATAAAAHWREADEAQRLEAFAAHPRIGDVELLRARYSRANVEQGQVLSAPEAVITRLKALNDAYFDRFGFIFIICASGRSAEEMLAAIEARVDNDRTTELDNAAAEQGKIMLLRLRDRFADATPGREEDRS